MYINPKNASKMPKGKYVAQTNTRKFKYPKCSFKKYIQNLNATTNIATYLNEKHGIGGSCEPSEPQMEFWRKAKVEWGRIPVCKGRYS